METCSCKMSDRTKFFIVAGIVASFCLPIFRSGGKTNLNFWGWIINHTIFAGPGPEYVPEEDYMAEMQGVKCTTLVTLSAEQI